MSGMNANEIQRQARNAVRKGSIAEIDLAHGLCRVAIGDDDNADEGLTTNWIPWLSPAAGAVREWRVPTVGEQVMLLCPMGDPAQGVALCGFFSDAFPAPSAAGAEHLRQYPDGARVAYDHNAHLLTVDLPANASITINAPGSVTVTSQLALVTAERVTLDADVEIERSLLVKGPLAFEAGMTGKGTGESAVMVIDGSAAFAGDVTSQGISLPHHTHREQGDGNLVSAPQNMGGAAS